MFGKLKVAVLGLLLALSTTPLFAQVDVTEATDSIASAVTGGSTVLIALIGAFGLFLGYKIVMSIVKRG
jgi:hypothetical protein